MNLASPYWSLVSNQEVNGYDGFRIIPRWASEVYFNVRSLHNSTPAPAETRTGAAAARRSWIRPPSHEATIL
jgi:hypothetical protein